VNAYPFADLSWILKRGLERGGDLLSAGEAVVVQQILSLDSAEGFVFARLTARKRAVFHIETLKNAWDDESVNAIARLKQKGLVCGFVPAKLRYPEMSVKRLKFLCKQHGLATTGRKRHLIAQLSDTPVVHETGWFRMLHARLVFRLTQWAFLSAKSRADNPLLERMGVIRWVQYECTPGQILFERRAHLLAWETVHRGLRQETLSVGECVDYLERGPHTGSLSLRGWVCRSLMSTARNLERKGALADAGKVYRLLWEKWTDGPRAMCAIRMGRVLERSGSVLESYQWLSAVRKELSDQDRRELLPLGRRLGRATGLGWAPERPLITASQRTLCLPLAGKTNVRPMYTVGDTVAHVDESVSACIRNAGRTVIRGESGFLGTVYGLFFSSLYFLPVTGALPVPFMPGPIDVGRPGFAGPRQPHAMRLLQRIRDGAGEELVSDTWRRFYGAQLYGVRWELAPLHDWVQLTSSLPPETLFFLARYLLEGGRRRFAGFPDWVILPGDKVKVPDAFPRVLSPSVSFVEVKGPKDSLSGRQKYWNHLLVQWGCQAEIWKVSGQ
jgi:hypothetical protein